MGGTVAAAVVGLVVGADWIVGADGGALQCTAKNMRKAGHGPHQAAQGALRPRGGGVDQDAEAARRSANAGQGIDTLLERARRIAAVERDLRHQRMREAVQQNVRRPRVVWRLVRESSAPMSIAAEELVVTLSRCSLLEPFRNGGLVEVDEDTLAELLDGG